MSKKARRSAYRLDGKVLCKDTGKENLSSAPEAPRGRGVPMHGYQNNEHKATRSIIPRHDQMALSARRISSRL